MKFDLKENKLVHQFDDSEDGERNFYMITQEDEKLLYANEKGNIISYDLEANQDKAVYNISAESPKPRGLIDKYGKIIYGYVEEGSSYLIYFSYDFTEEVKIAVPDVGEMFNMDHNKNGDYFLIAGTKGIVIFKD